MARSIGGLISPQRGMQRLRLLKWTDPLHGAAEKEGALQSLGIRSWDKQPPIGMKRWIAAEEAYKKVLSFPGSTGK